MGHQIEYMAAVSEQAVQQWLAQLDGFYCSDPGEVPVSWEGALRSGGTFWAHMTAEACNFSLAMKYSGLYHGNTPAVDFANRFEVEFWNVFGPVPLLRLDEYLFNAWQSETGQEWEAIANPVDALLNWLHSRDSHWHLLAPR
jgi:hypothetical protein